MNNNKIEKIKIIDYAIMLLLFFLTDSGLANYTGLTGYYVSMAVIVALGGVGLLKLMIQTKRRPITSFSYLLMICAFIAVTGIVLGSGAGPVLKYLCILFYGYFIAKQMSYEKFKTVYINICVFLAVVALIMYVIVVFIPKSITVFPTIDFTTTDSLIERRYITVYLCNMILVAGEELPRLYSIFWEPGVCQIYFNLAFLFLVLKEQEKRKAFKFILLIIAIIATQSTTGYIMCLCILVYYLLFVKKKRSVVVQFLQIAIVVFLFSIIINYNNIRQTELYNTVFYKLEEGTENVSAASRFYSFWGNLLLTFKNPIMGVGLNNSANLLNQLRISDYVLHQTNTVTNYLATFGVIIGSIFIKGWANFGKLEKVKGIRSVILFIMLFLCLSGENLIGSAVMNVLLMYGFIENFDKTRIERKML